MVNSVSLPTCLPLFLQLVRDIHACSMFVSRLLENLNLHHLPELDNTPWPLPQFEKQQLFFVVHDINGGKLLPDRSSSHMDLSHVVFLHHESWPSLMSLRIIGPSPQTVSRR